MLPNYSKRYGYASGRRRQYAIRFEESQGKYYARSEPPISIYPGIERSDLLRRLRKADVLNFHLAEIEQTAELVEREAELARFLRNGIMHDGFFHQGNYYQSNQSSLILIVGRTAQIPSMDFSQVFPIVWRDADNQYHEFSNADSWFDFFHSLQRHVETCDRNCYEIKQAIASNQSYDLSVGWPKTRFPVDLTISYFANGSAS